MPETKTAPVALWWTADGRLVPQDNPEALTLAYPEGAEISVEDQKALVEARRAEPEPVYSDVPGSGKDDAPGKGRPKAEQLPAEPEKEPRPGEEEGPRRGGLTVTPAKDRSR